VRQLRRRVGEGILTPLHPNRYLLFFSIASVGCAVDLATKHSIFARLGMPSPDNIRWIIPDVFGFQTSLNEGALFGMGQGWVVLFALLSVAAAIAIFLWLFWAGAARDRLLTVALACVTAGIFGNLYDRLGLHGLRWDGLHPGHAIGEPVYAVRDWILVMIGSRPWPTFNVADSLLVCGAAMLVWHAFYSGKQGQKTPLGVPQRTNP
jgi:signal peptidase II